MQVKLRYLSTRDVTIKPQEAVPIYSCGAPGGCGASPGRIQNPERETGQLVELG